jgi:cell wall assembly regulator SMI1
MPDIIDKAEIKQVASFLNDVHEDLCEHDGDAALHLHLTELYRIIRRLMDATIATEDQGLKVLLASLELRARQYMQEIRDS